MSHDLPYLERVKIQAEILLPLFRRMRAELGEAKAVELVRAAVAEYANQLGESLAAQDDAGPLVTIKRMMPAFTAGDALDVEPLANTERELTFNVRRCDYARFFHELGEPLLGRLLTCEIDPPLTDGIGGGLKLSRSQTIMGGASHCDFDWRVDR
jgi:hypothetical protein